MALPAFCCGYIWETELQLEQGADTALTAAAGRCCFLRGGCTGTPTPSSVHTTVSRQSLLRMVLCPQAVVPVASSRLATTSYNFTLDQRSS